MGELKCQCPARVTDFISTFVIVTTQSGQTIQGTLVNAANDHLEIEAGADVHIVFCCHICSVSQPRALG